VIYKCKILTFVREKRKKVVLKRCLIFFFGKSENKGRGKRRGLLNTPMVFEGSILVFAGSSGGYFCESHF
jgi:hypothetical protein